MIYYKTSQPVPGKGEAWMFYECNDDSSIRRYLTYIPLTGEIDKVPRPFVKKLQRPELLMPAAQEEFFRLWPPEDGDFEASPEDRKESREKDLSASGKNFHPDMTVGEAQALHPQVGEVFAAFHLGGCSSCGIAEVETIGQVCMGYGIDVDMLLEVLEGLMEQENAVTDEKPRAAFEG